MDQKKLKSPNRREFLKTAAFGAGAAAAATGLTAATVSAETVVEGQESAGYRETEHVSRYYELARQ